MAKCRINSFDVHYQEQGEANLPVLVLIHGLGCSLKYWTCVFEAEELSHYRILALDLPGFGMSEKPATYDYDLCSQADITYALLKELQIPKVSLIGHSMGGAIAIILAHTYPEVVERLLVIEPNLKANDAHLSREIIRHSEAEFIQSYEDFKRIAIDTVQKWFVNSHRADIEEYIGELLKTTPISMYRSAQSLMTVTADDTLLMQFRQFDMPKYFLIGEETMKTRNIPERLQQSDVQIMVVPGVGHMMMVDNPRLFTKTLASILP
jgi:pimeloyl-ACP methyl ester carboxylesterase